MDISIAKRAVVAINNKYVNIIETVDDQDFIVFNRSDGRVNACDCHWIKENYGKFIFPNNTNPHS